MSEAGVCVEVQDAVATITLERPEVMNRFEGAMREDLLEALRTVGRDPAVRTVLLTGAGDRAFSAGADVAGMVELHRDGGLDEIRRRVRIGGEIVRTIRALPLPVVAVLNGVAAGAGANLALACDVRLGSEQTAFVQSFVRIGLVPDWGGVHLLTRLVGAGRAADLMMTGTTVDGRRAHELGLLDRIFPASSLREEARAYAKRLSTSPAGALAEIKRGIELASTGSLDDVLAWELEAQPDLFGGADCLEGLEAFLERRPPAFAARREERDG